LTNLIPTIVTKPEIIQDGKEGFTLIFTTNCPGIVFAVLLNVTAPIPSAYQISLGFDGNNSNATGNGSGTSYLDQNGNLIPARINYLGEGANLSTTALYTIYYVPAFNTPGNPILSSNIGAINGTPFAFNNVNEVVFAGKLGQSLIAMLILIISTLWFIGEWERYKINFSIISYNRYIVV